MTVLFISDLHLCAKRPKTSELFLNFLETEASKAEALYILGDFFDVWVGDDNQDSHDANIITALAKLTQQGVPVYFMQGNRDFLIGNNFIQAINGHLLTDPMVLFLNQEPILLTHGDELCTLDKKYQLFRKIVRHPTVIKIFLKLPLTWRRAIAQFLRSRSSRRPPSHDKNPRHWDVAQSAVYHLMRENKAYTLIHGHTHQPNIHEFMLDGHTAKRIVLGDWGDRGSVLAYSSEGPVLKQI